MEPGDYVRVALEDKGTGIPDDLLPTVFDPVILNLTPSGNESGDAILRELQKIDPDISAIVSSGYSTHPVMAHYQDYGFKAALPKPYTVSSLSRIIKGALS